LPFGKKSKLEFDVPFLVGKDLFGPNLFDFGDISVSWIPPHRPVDGVRHRAHVQAGVLMADARIIAVTALAGALIGCGSRADPPPRDTTNANVSVADSLSAPLLGRFVGVLPCADCRGIHTELRLYAEQPSGRPTLRVDRDVPGDARWRSYRAANRALADHAGIGERP
jgi:hypothetical protein